MMTKHSVGEVRVFECAEAVYPGIEINGDPGRSLVVFGTKDEATGVRGDTPEQAMANAARLVKCWNSHDELVQALQTIASTRGMSEPKATFEDPSGELLRRMELARAVLAKVRGEGT
jgi:hypothetical protein